MSSIVEKYAASSMGKFGKRLYSHYDYFGYFIPSTWFIIGIIITEHILWGKSYFIIFLKGLFNGGNMSEGITISNIFIIILLLILSFNFTYALGHLLNGIASMSVHRIITRHLLGYPIKNFYSFYNFGKIKTKESENYITNKKRKIILNILKISYLKNLINIFPIILLEILLFFIVLKKLPLKTFSNEFINFLNFENFDFKTFALILLIASINFLLSIIHFGTPNSHIMNRYLKIKKEEKYKEKKENNFNLQKIIKQININLHIVLPIIISIIVLLISTKDKLLIKNSFKYNIITLSLLSSFIWIFVVFYFILSERIMRKNKKTITKKNKNDFKILQFEILKLKMLRPYYALANLASYFNSPPWHILEKAKAYPTLKTLEDKNENMDEVYWTSVIVSEFIGGIPYDISYHFLSMYAMNRNLSNVNFFLFFIGLFFIYLESPKNSQSYILIYFWFGALLVCSILFFTRYLYLYSSYYSKYLLRYLAFVTSENYGKEKEFEHSQIISSP